MNARNRGQGRFCCCGLDERAEREPRPRGRIAEVGGWTVSAAGLLLMPKCPACLAAYLAFGTGLTFSIPSAALVRVALITVFAASLIYLGARRMGPLIGEASKLITRNRGILF